MLYSTPAVRSRRDTRAMSTFRALIILLLAVATFAAGCGGDDENAASEPVPDDVVAVVGDRQVTVAQLNRQVELKLNAMKRNDQKPPTSGSERYRTEIVQPLVQSLVFAAQLRNIAAELDVSVSEADVDKALKSDIEQFYGGDRKRFEQDLAKFKVSEDEVRDQITLTLLQEKVRDAIVNETEVTDEQLQNYYDANKSDYATQDSRDVRFVLVDGRDLADRLRAQLADGGDWAKIAKKHSNDPGSAQNGGKFTATKGQVVPQFEKAAFSLDEGQLSQPIQAPKSYVGSACDETCFFVIEPTAPVKPGEQQSFDQVKTQIRSTLEQQRRQAHLQDRVKALLAAQRKVTRYNAAYQPPKESQPGGVTN
jgi:parvulin-like peptidyl-prolyl isomerase